jgi:H+/gluconate symporter-like permease
VLSVVTALLVAILTGAAVNWRRLRGLRETLDSGANASVLPILSVASLVGFGAVVAAVPAFEIVRNWVLSIEGGPLVSLAVATNLLSALTGSASGGLTIALDALRATYMRLATQHGIDPALLHRTAVMSCRNARQPGAERAVVTVLSVCGTTHIKSYFDIVMAAIVGPIIALAAVIALGSAFGSF